MTLRVYPDDHLQDEIRRVVDQMGEINRDIVAYKDAIGRTQLELEDAEALFFTCKLKHDELQAEMAKRLMAETFEPGPMGCNDCD